MFRTIDTIDDIIQKNINTFVLININATKLLSKGVIRRLLLYFFVFLCIKTLLMVIINNKGVDYMENLINWRENNKQGKLILTEEEDLLIRSLRKSKSLSDEYTTNLGVSSDFEFNNSTVVLFFYQGKPMFGRFKEYAKTKGYIICDIFKKKSTEFKSRPWRLNIDNIEVVEHNGIMTSEVYLRKSKNGYYEFIK